VIDRKSYGQTVRKCELLNRETHRLGLSARQYHTPAATATIKTSAAATNIHRRDRTRGGAGSSRVVETFEPAQQVLHGWKRSLDLFQQRRITRSI